MGSDDLFHKRKARSREALEKRHYRRAPYAKVLIVCEGEKTEPHYFLELRDHYRLEATNILISGDCGSDPMSVYAAAKDKYARHSGAGDPFDKVYCVFDQDTHANYQRAVDALSRARPAETWEAITSVPCFEYWILLHFNPTTRAFRGAGRTSGCQQVINDLENYLPGYSKGQRGLFDQLVEQLDFAIQNARRVHHQARVTGTDNPSTRIYELVEYLSSLGKASQRN